MDLADTLQLIYDKSAMKYLVKEVSKVLRENERMRENVKMLSEMIIEFCKGSKQELAQLKKYESAKEDARVSFDYYR